MPSVTGDSQLANSHPAPRIPPGTYDVGDGYLNADAEVWSYDGEELLRTATHEEEVWAKTKCRVSRAMAF